MTDIEQKALALVNEVMAQHCHSPLTWHDLNCSYIGEALCRAIEQHEAYKREVSDAVEAVFAGYHDAPIPWVVMRRKLEPFIIAKPDPLVDLCYSMGLKVTGHELREAIDKRGGKIVWGEK